MRNHLTDGTSNEVIDLKSMTGEVEPAQAEAISLWIRCTEKIRDWLVRAERRVTEGFRVPPNGG